MIVHSKSEARIYMDKYILLCDNVVGYEVSTWVHGWPYEMVYDGMSDTGRDESILVDTELLLGSWFICECLYNAASVVLQNDDHESWAKGGATERNFFDQRKE